MSLKKIMKGVYLTGHGGFDKLEYREDIPVPELENNEVIKLNINEEVLDLKDLINLINRNPLISVSRKEDFILLRHLYRISVSSLDNS